MNIKDKLFVSYNICLIAFILVFSYFSISRHIDKILQLAKLNGAINYIVNTKGYLSQEDVSYFLNQIKEIKLD